MEYRVLGITWKRWASTHPSVDKYPDYYEFADAQVYNGPVNSPPTIGESYGDFALILDYESDAHDWQHDRSRVLFDDIVEGWKQ